MNRFVSILFFVCGACLVRAVAAEEIFGTVLIVGMTECCADLAYPEAEEALEEEFSLANIPFVRQPAPSAAREFSADDLQRAAEKNQANAAVRITRNSEKKVFVDVWVAPPTPSQHAFRTIAVAVRPELPEPMITAVRTVETLRAGFLAFRIEQDAKTVDKPVTTAAPSAISPEPAHTILTAKIVSDKKIYRLGLGVAGNAALSPGGTGSRGAFSLQAIVQPMSGIDLELSALWSPTGKTLKTDGTTSELTFGLFRGWVHYRFRSESIIQPSIGLGAGTFVGKAEGMSSDGEPLKTARTFVAYLGGAARLFAFPKKNMGFFLETTLGALLPEAVVMHGTTQAAHLGRPLVEIHLGMQIRFFSS